MIKGVGRSGVPWATSEMHSRDIEKPLSITNGHSRTQKSSMERSITIQEFALQPRP